MSDNPTNAAIAAALAEIKTEIQHLKSFVGEKPNEGLRGEVAILIGIKNKGWGLVAGILIFAGAVGASIKTALIEVFK
jgi:hypothetical protein